LLTQSSGYFIIAGGSKDSQLFPGSDEDCYHPDTGNKGLFGVNAQYEVPFTITSPSDPKLLSAFLRAGNFPVGSEFKYMGAILDLEHPGIGPLRAGNTNNAVELFRDVPITNHLSFVHYFTNAVGGAATTPPEVLYEWRDA